MAALRCFLMRYTKAGGESGWAMVVDRSEDEARRTIIDAFDYQGQDATITLIGVEAAIEGRYLILAETEGK